MITLRKKFSGNTRVVSCRAEDSEGDAVRIVSVEMDQITVNRVNPAYPEQMPAWGVIVQKYTPTRCLVQTSGEVRLPSTATLSPGRVCYVGADGRLTTATPEVTDSPSGRLVLQEVGLANGPAALNFIPSPLTVEIGI